MNKVRELVLSSNGNSEKPDLENGSLFFIGTATVLLRYAGFTILTDPNFLHQGDHVHLGYGIRSSRKTNPALEIEQLPPLDMVVLSHMHDDHFDRVAATKLDKNLPIITTHHAAADLKEKGFTSPQALKTWETLTVTKGDTRVRITAMPGRHGPGILAAVLPPVMGSMLEFQSAEKTVFRLYITGDTLIYEDLKEIPQRYSDIDLALLHLGGTKVFGILLTMDAKQGVQAIQIIAPRLSIPIHFNDYTVFKSPLEDFMQAVTAAGLDGRVRYLSHGETYTFNVSPIL
ncbi:MBL fold metallo-hydrolase [Chroococcidiopsis sp. CCMEE 29]|uniref:MBL fold metallo-hydrolase n=1 Tax=Chroococcidiopsis sp. CCMEE 29 TaxID=155894 RepID=UPI0020225E34|nr:MBL fold metallo-hydrolase [Chroococcidiopsis sp. CCMEE 29]